MTQTPFGAVPQPTLIYGLLSATLPLPQLAPLEPFIRPIAAANAPGLNTPPVYPVLGPDQTATNMDYTQFVTESSTGFLTAQWDVAAQVSLKSMTTYRTVRVHNNLDLDGTAQDYINTFQHIRNSDFSQELQLNATSDKAALVAGVYYLHGIDGEPSDDTISPRTQLTTITTEQQLRSDQIVKSYAVYGNLDYNLTQALRLSLGARFTHEDVGIDLQDVQTNTTLPQLAIAGTAYAFPLLNSPLAIGTAQAIAFGSGGALKFVAPTSVTNVTNVSPSAAFKRFTPSAKLAYDLNPHTMGYVGYAEGYKAGGFDTFRPFTQFNPEKVKSYTVGLKTTTPDSRLRFNTELFYNDYTDKQLSTVFLIDNSLGKVTKNAGQVHTYGVDMDLAWVTPLKGLRAGLTAGYLKTKVQHYFDIDANTGQLIDRAPNTRLGFSPEWTGAVNLSYTMPLAAVGELTFAGNVAYRSMSYTDSPIDLTSTAASLEVQRAHATENAGITYRTSDERWHVALEGRNLSDKRVITNSFNAGVGTVIGQYNDPRTWSLSVGYNFK
jgi:iron complex outermembrane receptor protein